MKPLKLQRSGTVSNTPARYDRTAAASPWVLHHMHLIPSGGIVLDLACGNGRHLRALSDAGYEVCGVDRDTGPAEALTERAAVTLQQCDLEAGRWPFGSAEFAGIVVTNYLHRPLFPCIADSLQPGGVLIYETFAQGNERFGRPRNPDFLLRPGELRAVFGMLQIIAAEEVTESGDAPAVRQRIVARLSSGCRPTRPAAANARARKC